MAEVANAYVTLAPSAKGFGRKLDSDIGPQLDKSGKAGSKRLGSSLAGGLKSALGPAIGILSVAGVGGLLKGSIAEARESQKVGAQTAAVIKSTGGAARVSAKEFGSLATAISNKVGIDDEAIQAGENMLATFTNVRNEVGKGNDIFTQATKVATDMGVALKMGPVQANLQLGKALNDPIKGMTKLQRVGVTFTDQQKKQVAQMVKVGDTAGAQKVILKELAKEFGGSAAAQVTAGEKAQVAFDNLKETIGTALLPVIDKLETKLTNDIIPAVSDFVTGMQNGTGAGGRFAHTLGDIYADLQPIGSAIKTVVSAFSGLPGSAQKVLLLAGALLILKSRFGDSIPSAESFNRESAVAVAKTVALRGGALAAGVGLATLASKAGGVTTELGALATVGAGIATGFAVGGPIGAAIGGAAGVLSVLRGRSAAAAAAQRSLNTAGRAVAATLNEQTGALTKNTRATAAKQLADTGAFTAADKVGVSYKTVLAAALGNATAQDRLSAAVAKYVRAQDLNSAAGKKAAGAAGLLLSATNSTSGAIDHERTKVNQTATALGNLGGKHAKPTVNVIGVDGAITKVTSLLGLLSGLSHKKFNGKVPAGMFDPNAHAKGTNDAPGGWSIVGEKGPELLNLAKHSTVIPNNKISSAVNGSSMTSGAGGGTHPIVLDGMVVGYLHGMVTDVVADQANLAATTGRQHR